MTPKVYLETLAVQGRKWFAQPPEGFEPPPRTARIAMAGESRNFYSSKTGASLKSKLETVEHSYFAIHLTYAHVLQSWMKQNGTTIFVSPDMIDACEQTDVLDHIEGSDIKTVHKVGYLSLPTSRGFHSPYTGGNIRHIFFSIFENGESLPVYMNGTVCHKLIPPGRRLFMQAYWDNNEDCSSYSLPLDTAGKSLMQVLNDTRENLSFEDITRLKDEYLLRMEARHLGLWMGSLVVNLCLIMQSYPQYVNALPSRNSERQSFNDVQSPKSIIINRAKSVSLTTVILVRADVSPRATTGRTRELKKRRGHWRRQPHGDRFEIENPEVHVIVLEDGRHAHMKWIEPWLNPNLFSEEMSRQSQISS